jgi:hypothetical protein
MFYPFQTDQKSRIELEFVNSLISIGNRLKGIQTRYEKSKRLICELFLLNLNLPARVWLPLYSDNTAHLVVRIPYTEGCVLNSKDRAPYCIYCEVIEVDSVDTASLPEKNAEEQINQLALIRSIASASAAIVPRIEEPPDAMTSTPIHSEHHQRNDLAPSRSEPVLNGFGFGEDEVVKTLVVLLIYFLDVAFRQNN